MTTTTLAATAGLPRSTLNHDSESVGFIPRSSKVTKIPTMDLHKVEEALKDNYKLYNGTPLTNDELRRGIAEYRQFWADHKASGMPERFEVPSFLVDRVWHTHMCETEQYASDCKAYFGRMFHHRSSICNSGMDPDGNNPGG